MNVRDELHRLVDALDVRDAKRRLHVLVAELDEETARQILTRVVDLRRRRGLDEWGFRV
jgi:hypothetical protein